MSLNDSYIVISLDQQGTLSLGNVIPSFIKTVTFIIFHQRHLSINK